MPLANRTIQPVWLGRRPLSEEEKSETLSPIAVCHNSVLGAIVQLASLVRHADDIFCDLAEECQSIFEKTECIAGKIRNVERIVKQLDSTEVKIPVGTLKQFSTVTDHHVAKHGFDCDHFTPASRPHCIKFSYSRCEVTPVHALRGADLYRKDGQCSSHLFKLWPIALKDTPVGNDDMTIPTKFYTSLLHKKKYKALKLKERRRTINSVDDIMQEDAGKGHGGLRASKAEHLSKSQPSIVVSVNTSGAGFERMASFRQSLKDDDEGVRIRDRKRRRRTVSGVPDNIMHEIEQFEQERRAHRSSSRVHSLDDLDQKDLEVRDEIMQQYLLEIDAAIEERQEEEYAEQQEGKLLKFLPCRRSRSLPRCVKLISGSRGKDGLTKSSLYPKKPTKISGEENRPRQPADGLQSKYSSNTSLGSHNGGGDRSSRAWKRSSLIGDKIKSLVAGTMKPRPKSLDFDSLEVREDNQAKRGSNIADRSSSLSRVSSPSMPEGIMSRAASNESQIGPGSYYYFDSNTLPRAQAKKYDFPWDSLPKDWTTSVKLREISKRRKEDRQSSSGNWSQSGYSSNRQSLDSDAKSSMPSATSQYSLGKDSGRDSPRSAGEGDGLDTGYMGDAASTESVSDTKSVSNTDSDEWIRSLAERAASRGDVTSTSAEALANLSRLTKQNIRNLDILVPGRAHLRQRRNELEDDGESSVYSLDQEGFYTSFHNDSGLRRSANNLLDEDDDLMMPRVRETKSLQNVASCNAVQNAIFRPQEKDGIDTPRSSSMSFPNLTSLSGNRSTLLSNIFEVDNMDGDESEDLEGQIEFGDTGTLKAKKKLPSKSGKMAPPPPPRTTSIKDPKADDGLIDDNAAGGGPSSIETASECSDHETIYARLKLKTSISVHTIPSWCTGIISDDDDFQDRLNAESSELEELFSSGTLPSVGSDSRISLNEDLSANSWPRGKRTLPLQPGILKTPDKDRVKSFVANTKTLNFDPVVNLFDARSPHGVQLPLSRLSSSDESGSPSGTNTFDSHPLAVRQDKFPTSRNSQDMSSKYQPTLSISPVVMASKTPSAEMTLGENINSSSTSTPISSCHSVPARARNTELDHSDDLSFIPSQSTTLVDSFDGITPTPLSSYDKSADTLSSNSTIALSDFDSSLTHVTLEDSTSGSALSLNWDTDDTPNPTPVHKRAPHDLSWGNSVENSPYDKGQRRSVPSVSHDCIPATLSSSSTSSSGNQPQNYLTRTEVQKPGYSSTLAYSGITQPESGPVLIAPSLPPPSNSITPSVINTQTAQSISMQFKDPNSNSGAFSINDRENTSDKNNNIPKDSYFLFPDTNEPLSRSSLTENQSTRDQPHIYSDKLQSHPISVQSQWNVPPSSGPSHFTSQYQHANIDPMSSRSDRRKSSPVMTWKNSREIDYSAPVLKDGSIGNNVSGSIRRNSNGLHSPADSGFGSPSAVNQPSMTVQPFSYSSSSTHPHQYVPDSRSQTKPSSKVPYIKQPLFGDSKLLSSNVTPMLPSGNGKGSPRSERPVKAHSSGSDESLNSQFSSSSSHTLISRNQKTDLSQPLLQRGNSSESVHSTGSAGRTDSYRVAMLTDNDEASLIQNQKSNIRLYNGSGEKNSNSHIISSSHASMTKSVSAPANVASNSGDIVPRADSYRCAMRNTQSAVLSDLTARNSSYRLATYEEDIVAADNRMDACNLWSGKTGGTRDFRRMGITDVDQLKNYNNNELDASRPGARRGATVTAAARNVDTIHSKKKLGIRPDTEGLINSSNKTAPEPKKFLKSSKDKNKQKTQSSTYIRFDPIFESGEDLRASRESLRPPSIVSVRTLAKGESSDTLTSENAYLMGQKMGPSSQVRRRSGSQGRKSGDERPGLSLLGSIKTTIKSIGGKGE